MGEVLVGQFLEPIRVAIIIDRRQGNGDPNAGGQIGNERVSERGHGNLHVVAVA